MDRCTTRKGNHVYIGKSAIDIDGCIQESLELFCHKARECPNVTTRNCPMLKAADHLADYEDTDMTPEEIIQLKAENEQLEKDVAKEFTCFVGDPHKVEQCPYVERLTKLETELDTYKNAEEIIHPPILKVNEKYKALGKNYWCECGVMFTDWENNPTNYCGNCGRKLR